MMDEKDFERFEEFKQEQIKVLKEKGESRYKNKSYKETDEEELLDDLFEQIDRFDYSDDPEDKKRRMLHIANYAFFLYDNSKGS